MKNRNRLAILAMGGCLLLGSTQAAEAKTIGLEREDGTLRYIVEKSDRIYEEIGIPDGSGKSSIPEDEPRAQEATDAEDLTAADDGKLDRAGSQQMKEDLAFLERYGVTYDAEEDVIRYQGRIVRLVIDAKPLVGCVVSYRGITDRADTAGIDIYTVRDEVGAVTGVREATEEEYAAKTQELKELDAASPEMSVDNYVMLPDGLAENEVSVGAYFESIMGEEPDECGDSAVEQVYEVTVKEGGKISVSKEGEKDAEILAEGNDAIAETAEGYTSSWQTAEERKKIAEYERAGIGRSAKGGWTWEGQEVYLLFDEDGSISSNNSDDTRDHRIYLYVSRNADGSLASVEEITGRDLLQRKADLDTQQ